MYELESIAAENFLDWRVEFSESDNDAMNGGEVWAFARPLKSLMNEIDFDAALEKVSPKRRDGKALTDGISGDEGAGGFVVDKISGFLVPGGDVV